jgi:DNA-binding beta-propeller fold protein YncE
VLGAPLFADGALWVTDSGTFGEFLLRLDPAALMVTGELKVGGRAAGVPAVAAAGGSLWLAGGDELLRVSPVTVAQTTVVALPGAVSSSVAASPDGSVLVVSTSGPSGSAVQRRDPRTGSLLAAHPAAGAAVIDGVAGAGVWVSMAARAERYATATMTPEASVTAGGSDIQVAGGRLWVSGGRARDYCADASSGRRLATLPGPGPRQARLLAVAGRVLYYAEPAVRGGGTGIAAVPAPAGCG